MNAIAQTQSDPNALTLALFVTIALGSSGIVGIMMQMLSRRDERINHWRNERHRLYAQVVTRVARHIRESDEIVKAATRARVKVGQAEGEPSVRLRSQLLEQLYEDLFGLQQEAKILSSRQVQVAFGHFMKKALSCKSELMEQFNTGTYGRYVNDVGQEFSSSFEQLATAFSSDLGVRSRPL